VAVGFTGFDVGVLGEVCIGGSGVGFFFVPRSDAGGFELAAGVGAESIAETGGTSEARGGAAGGGEVVSVGISWGGVT
jgi:hypothetical protein